MRFVRKKYTEATPKHTPKPTTLKRVISSGQQGSDLAAIQAAKTAGIRTGGYTTTDFDMLDGRNRFFHGPRFGIKGLCKSQPEKIRRNIESADAIIRMGLKFDTPTAKNTLEQVRQSGKPLLDVFMQPSWWDWQGDFELRLDPDEIARWITKNAVQTLYVTGDTSLEIEIPVYMLLLDTFNIMLWD